MSSEIIWKYEKPNYEILLEKLEKLQKENKESKELYNKLLTGYNKLVQEYLELEKENQELKRCIDAQKIMRKDMPKDTKLILMYSEDYKRIFKEE